MKKTLYLLLTIIVFTACGGDDPDPIQTKFDNWNDPTNPNYTNGKYNPIEGEWQLIQRNGQSLSISEFLIYKFDSSFNRSEAKTEPAEEQHPQYSNAKKYVLNDKEYKIDNTIYQYAIAGTLENARLTIKEETNTLTFKPYESKVWTWKGDWNDPSNPHYAIYNGKYNPIKGTWKLTHVGGDPIPYIRYYRFNEDFTIEQSAHPSAAFDSKRKYWINDIGVKEDSFTIGSSHFSSDTYSYKIEGNTLYYRTMLPKPSEGMTLVRYK